jgi:pimeloyl-ACP methyl ester carboxylesterase
MWHRPSSRNACRTLFSFVLLLSFCTLCQGQASAPAPAIKAVDIGGGIRLHYVEQGSGTPLIFVHGSLSDGSYWADQIAPFSKHYHVIAYSRRYNYPNDNPARAGYSAITDADDLAGLIRVLHLEKAVVIGHSYGALTALFLAVRHPDLIRAMVLAEPPAVSLLAHLTGAHAKAGTNFYDDIQHRMVQPMQQLSGMASASGASRFSSTMYSTTRTPGKRCRSPRAKKRSRTHTSGTL